MECQANDIRFFLLPVELQYILDSILKKDET